MNFQLNRSFFFTIHKQKSDVNFRKKKDNYVNTKRRN